MSLGVSSMSHFLEVESERTKVARDVSCDHLVLEVDQGLVCGRAGPLNSYGLKVQEHFLVGELLEDL